LIEVLLFCFYGTDGVPASLQLQHLPVEMLDWILMKVLYFTEYDWVKTKQYVSNNALLRKIIRLQTVTSAWRNRLNTNWFRIVFKRQRKRMGEKIEISCFPEVYLIICVFMIY